MSPRGCPPLDPRRRPLDALGEVEAEAVSRVAAGSVEIALDPVGVTAKLAVMQAKNVDVNRYLNQSLTASGVLATSRRPSSFLSRSIYPRKTKRKLFCALPDPNYERWAGFPPSDR